MLACAARATLSITEAPAVIRCVVLPVSKIQEGRLHDRTTCT
jgi:hypothetical protein